MCLIKESEKTIDGHSCNFLSVLQGSCSVFDFNVKSQSNREWVADIVLREVLDYEAPTRPTQLRLEAFVSTTWETYCK